ncbi:MAG: ferredoxin, partial [Planctomycetia bacterium]|nr:ferredoxin [Planctomycetia bacterium]
PESRTETYTVTRCDQVPENTIENYTTRVCVPVTKEVEVQVCRMVPKVVSVTVQPCPAGCEQNAAPAPSGKGMGPQQAPPPAPQKGSLTSVGQQGPPPCCGG